jgi:hypothetical protein
LKKKDKMLIQHILIRVQEWSVCHQSFPLHFHYSLKKMNDFG